jgi:hypothetical protein
MANKKNNKNWMKKKRILKNITKNIKYKEELRGI